jgi:DNA integrity scanning protein DisA with diadenylate cyclase activity
VISSIPFDLIFPFKRQSLLETLVISFIVHRILALLWGTAAFHVVLGLVFLWLVQDIAKSAGLVLTSWFFQGLGALAGSVIVLVFRCEINELLIQTNPVFKGPRLKVSYTMGSNLVHRFINTITYLFTQD